MGTLIIKDKHYSKMKTKVTKSELKECVKNALQKVLEENNKEFRSKKERDRERGDNFKKKAPKHGKMGPIKNDKYKNNWGDDDE